MDMNIYVKTPTSEKKPSLSRSSSADVSLATDGNSTFELTETVYTEKELKAEKLRIYKNIILISLAFLFNFNSFGGLSRLQSSLHKVEGLGVKANAAMYLSLMISCMFLPTIVIRVIGHKWTIAVSFLGYLIYMAANGYAVWATMMPAAVLVGLCAAPLWTAQSAYFTIIGSRLGRILDDSVEDIIAKFFGIFFMFYQMATITGSIISATVLKPEPANPNETEPDFDLAHCGSNDCPWYNFTNPNLAKPDETTVWIMVGIYIAIALLAFITVAFFVDNLKKEDVPEPQDTMLKEVRYNFLATFKHLRYVRQLLLIPVSMYSGFEQAFHSAEFSRSYISCTLGIWKIGLITLPYGIVNSSVAYLGGHVTKYIGRIPLFTGGFLIDLSIQLTLLFWKPVPEESYVLYILASMWGFSDGIWQAQLNTLVGVAFPKEPEAAFANYRLWESFGFIVAYLYSDYICTSAKLYALTSMLFLGVAGVYIVEYLLRKEKKKQKYSSSDNETAEKSIPNDNPAFEVEKSAPKNDQFVANEKQMPSNDQIVENDKHSSSDNPVSEDKKVTLSNDQIVIRDETKL